MDASTALIADYAQALRFGDLSREVVHECKRRVIDTLGVSLGAFDAEPSRIARRLALRAPIAQGSRIVGTVWRVLPELAAFANGVMARYLDGNDGSPGGAGHPSDTICAVLAAADLAGANGETIITAITLAYEISFGLESAVRLREKGMDNVFYTAVAAAIGAAKVFGLNHARTAEAVSLAVTPNIALDATRYGHLSTWKGCAGGNAARNGVFAALLAAEGVTGPADALDGGHGLRNLTGAFQIPPLGGGEQAFKITQTTLKCFLAEGHSLSPITAALQLSTQISADEIEKVTIYTYKRALDVIGSEPEKWRPTNRETADHSLPYIISAVLCDGAFRDDIFADQRLRDPRIRRLIDLVDVVEDPQLSRRFPQCLPCRIEVKTRDGSCKIAENDYPRGHPRNPMTDQEVNAKFRGLASRVLPAAHVDRALAALWRLDAASNLDDILKAMEIAVATEMRGGI